MATVAHESLDGPESFPSINRDRLTALQVNLGYRCNQACHHCHVDAGPNRTEQMARETIGLVVSYAEKHQIDLVDLTGGAPELNPHFRRLVTSVKRPGRTIIDRCNLTILEETGQSDLAEFLAANNVKVVASLPCYSEENVDLQRGKGVFEKSIRGLKRLNGLGYGRAGSGLELDLVYNPVGPHLPPPQQALEQTYKRELREQFDIEFNQLLTLTNMPIARFRHALIRDGLFDDYMSTLKAAFQAANLAGVMCRNLISVDWQGYVYDCDFNQMLGIPLGRAPAPVHLTDILDQDLNGRTINVADHCFGCTAGQGSSCGGALSE